MRILSAVGTALLAVALVACSSGRDKSKTAKGRDGDIPEMGCPVDPRRFADAEKIRDFGNGHGCGVRNAWRIHAVNGVRLSQPLVMNCAVANTLSQWITEVVQPAAEDRYGEHIVAFTVPAGYSCRTRNNVRGAKLSEHALGNAVDISGFRLESGETVTVEQGWFASHKTRKFLAKVRHGACGPFKTVLGPGADRHHEDHLHLDLQRHRGGGAYCR
jgi:hypothetical protein